MYPSVSKLRHCFYAITLELSQKSYARSQYLFQVFCLLYTYSRFSLIYYGVYLDSSGAFSRYDYSTYLYQAYPEVYNHFLTFCTLLFELFIFALSWLLYHVPENSYNINWITQIVVENQNIYRESLYDSATIGKIIDRKIKIISRKFKQNHPFISRLFPKFILTFGVGKLAYLSLWMSMDHLEKPKFASTKLAFHPNLSLYHRLMLLKGHLFQDSITFFAFQIGLFLFIIPLGYPVCERAYPILFNAPLYLGPICLILDLLVIWYQIFQIVYLSVFFTMVTYTSSYINTVYCRAITRHLKETLHLRRSKKMSLVSLYREVTFFLEEHQRCIEQTIRGNGELFSRVLFVYLLTNVPGKRSTFGPKVLGRKRLF